MSPIHFRMVPPIDALARDVEYFRIAEYKGTDGLAVKVCPNGLPGVLFQYSGGQSAIQSIITGSGHIVDRFPTLYLYGQITELAVMNFKKGPYTTVQAVLKPHALKTVFGMDASLLTNGSLGPHEFHGEDLNARMKMADCSEDYISLLNGFLLDKIKQAAPRDELIEQTLDFIHTNITSVTVNRLLGTLYLSERQFEKRFVQTVGITPQLYIRIKRFNEAIRLMDTGQYERLSDVAHALNFHDQSHFIRDIKLFSGITPKNISQKVNSFHHDEIGSSYLA